MRPFVTLRQSNQIALSFLLMTTVASVIGAALMHLLDPVPGWLPYLLFFCLLYAGACLLSGVFGLARLAVGRITGQPPTDINGRMVLLLFLLPLITGIAFIAAFTTVHI
ncbi:MAG: hypothetical protein HZY76_11930 [Anaerolineae bacterium]|nr:MAG: hypothetical protein HZY76_11930 [Anaerolineae bacterium]